MKNFISIVPLLLASSNLLACGSDDDDMCLLSIVDLGLFLFGLFYLLALPLIYAILRFYKKDTLRFLKISLFLLWIIAVFITLTFFICFQQ